mmetsp:Transcript_47570/g.152847  ORF Transcript_47570/g.152847 Transcript_47570/m.152847 type:complete len:412 (-) Transcript_47570:220-1455(-)
MAAPPSGTMRLCGDVEMPRAWYLAGFKGASYPTVPSAAEQSEAAREGTIDDLALAFPEERLQGALFNDVKACKCGKPCAFTLEACNACGASLKEVAITKSENVFSAFLFGVKKAQKGFPYTISLRRQTSEVLIFDDMLALTPCHLNGISSKYYIPDWRFLLTDPAAALKLLDVLEDELWTATLPFLQNAEFRRKIFKGNLTDEEIRGKVMKSFNFPPSQFQMHIQWLVPPLVPFQHYMAELRNHFHEGRAFPVSYVRKVLQLNKPYDVMKETPIADIIAFYDNKGVVYKDCWTEFFEKCIQDSIECANWSPEDFEYVVDAGKAYSFKVENGSIVKGAVVEGVNPGDLQKNDCAALQNYGRPYTVEGKPSGTYIKTPLEPKIGPGGYQDWPGVFSQAPMRDLEDREYCCAII